MKRILIMALVLLLCAGLGACAAALDDESGQCGENLTWTLNADGALTISGTEPMWDYDGDANLSPFDENE